MQIEATQAQLEQTTASLWEKNGKRRMYFNNLRSRVGLDLTYHKTGSIKSAEFGGEHISNSDGYRILGDLDRIKVWVDCETCCLHITGVDKSIDTKDYLPLIQQSVVSEIERAPASHTPASLLAKQQKLTMKKTAAVRLMIQEIHTLTYSGRTSAEFASIAMSPEKRPTFLNIGKAIKSARKLCELGERLTETDLTELDSLMDEMVRGRDYISNLLHSCLFDA